MGKESRTMLKYAGEACFYKGDVGLKIKEFCLGHRVSFFLNPHPRTRLPIFFREREHSSVTSHTCPERGSNPHLHMFPDWGWNPQPFGVWDDERPTEPLARAGPTEFRCLR